MIISSVMSALRERGDGKRTEKRESKKETKRKKISKDTEKNKHKLSFRLI